MLKIPIARFYKKLDPPLCSNLDCQAILERPICHCKINFSWKGTACKLLAPFCIDCTDVMKKEKKFHINIIEE